jgi:integrase
MHELEDHLARLVAPDPGALVFARENGLPVSRNEVSDAWRAACASVGIVPWSKPNPGGLRLHDLRHHAGTIAARTGATTKEIMRRMGHSTPRAALIYQHATDERDQAIARQLDEVIAAAQRDQRPVVVELSRHGRAMESGTAG